jgi:hypothetical protein
MAVEYLDNGNDDGTVFGASDAKIGFYGLAAPIVKQTLTIITAGDTIASVLTDLARIRTVLYNLGLCTSSGP